MAKMYEMDLVITPYVSFAMMEIQGVENDSNNFFQKGKIAVPTTPISYQKIIEHIIRQSMTYPDVKIESFYDRWARVTIPNKTFENLLNEKGLHKLTVNSLKENKGIPDNPYNSYYCRQDLTISIWMQLIKQHGQNFLSFPKVGVAGIKYKDNELRLSDSVGGANNGHGDFEIQVFEVLKETEKTGIVYPIKTLELRLKDTITGQGIYDFEDKF